jgi:AmiR/NasT family two-component response regulator
VNEARTGRGASDTHPLPQVHQACGIVADQVDCGPSEALARMTALAVEVDLSIEQVAHAVLDGSIRFDY